MLTVGEKQREEPVSGPCGRKGLARERIETSPGTVPSAWEYKRK